MLPPPLWGRAGEGWGGLGRGCRRIHSQKPPPLTPPHKGEGNKLSVPLSLRSDGFEPAFGYGWSEAADHDEHDRHGAGNEAEHADRAVAAKKERDDEAGEDRGKPAP